MTRIIIPAVGGPSGAAELGTDGTVGGPGGSPLSSSLANVGSAPAGSSENQALIVRSDGTLAYIALPSISTKAWGAKSDGVTNDLPAVQAAIDQAAANFAASGMPQAVELGQGTAYLNDVTNGGLKVPRNCPLTVNGQGKHSTRIKLSTNTPRAFDFRGQQVGSAAVTGTLTGGSTSVTGVTGSQANFMIGMLVTHPSLPLGTTLEAGVGTGTWTLSAPASAGGAGATLTCSDLFTGLTFRGFTVDANNVQSRDAVILGVQEAGVSRYYVSCRDVTFEDCRTINVPSVVSTGDYTQASSARSSIFISCDHHEYGEPLRSILIRVRARNCEFVGGDTGMYVGASGGQYSQISTVNQLTTFTATLAAGTGNQVGYAYYRLVALDVNGYPCWPSAESFCLMSGTNLQAALAWTIPTYAMTGTLNGTTAVTSLAGTLPPVNSSVSVTGTNIPAATTMLITGASTGTLSKAATGTGSISITGTSNISSIVIYKGAVPGWYTQNQAVSASATTFTDVGTGWTAGGLTGPAYSINCFFDEIWAVNCEHDLDPERANIATSYAPAAGFQFGGRGYGGRAGMIDCRVPFGAGDDAYELDGHAWGLIHNCSAIDAINDCGLYINSLSWPVAPQTTVVSKFRSRYNWTGAIPQGPIAVKINAAGGGGPPHIVKVKEFNHTTLNPSLQSIAAFGVFSTAAHRVELDDFQVEAPAINVSATSQNCRAIIIGSNMFAGEKPVVTHVVMRNVRGQVAGPVNGFSVSGAGFIALGGGTFVLDWDGIEPDFDLQGAANHSLAGIIFGVALNIITQGDINNYKPRLQGDSYPYAFSISNSYVVVTRRIRFGNSDFSNVAGNSSSVAALTVNYVGKIYADAGHQAQAGYPQTPYGITAPATTVYQQHAEGIPGKLYIVGGAGTAINFSRNDSSIQNVLTQASAAFPGTIIDIEPGDWYAITYSTVPTVTFIPSRK